MQALVDVILPVFLVIGFGYLAVWRNWFSDAGVNGLMKFTQNFAIPCLLFSAIAGLDLSASFDLRLVFSFYTGALSGFVLGLFGALVVFKRPIEDAVVIGFCCLFSNSVLLGLPLTERAYGPDALEANFAIIALHSPFCYGVGITVMEVVRAKGQAGPALLGRVLKAMFSNALIVGIVLGLLVNLSGIALPQVMQDGLDLMSRAALPAALFGLGGVLASYRPEGDMRLVIYICLVSLIVHPLITRGLGLMVSLPVDATRSAVLTAAMAPGVNAYIFASMYGRAMRVAATAVLVGTGLTILTAWVWLGVLP
ncbi:AEC family transporter [Roseovarius rhodophyticola]|uniref:AEC family transporter n=1 Tax=Roseovarius rhodophyticola TaxID=3080827 RepID=A0ABZ2TCL8_9RHOB|nr:AEC family transporter [Roseovarius sp. W115]MDV2931197.1 AEC family transporter [Roseovarius sp. W115]